MSAAQTEIDQNKSAKSSPGQVRETERVMIKRINTRFLFTTLGIFVGLGVALYFLHGYQLEGNAGKLKERAAAAEAEGEYDKAMQLYGQYLNFRENDFDTLLHFLRLRDGLATSPAALNQVFLGYEELLRRDPGRPDEAEIRQDIIAVAITLGQHGLAQHHLEALLEGSTFQDFRDKHSDQLPQLTFQWARTHEANGRIKEAFEAYVRAIEMQLDQHEKMPPGQRKFYQHRFYLPLALLFANEYDRLPRREGPEEGEAQIETIDKSELTLSDKIKALLPQEGLTDAQMEEKAREAGDQILQWMVENAEKAEKPAEAYLIRAAYYHDRGRRFDEARQDVESARATMPQDPSLLLFSAELANDQASQARVRGPRAGYFDFIRLARRDAARGRANDPRDARFHLLQSLIENEAREGIFLLPAVAERHGETAKFPKALKTPRQQKEWELFQNAEQALRDGLDAIAQSLADLKDREPVRASLRVGQQNQNLSRYQLTQLAIRLRWSLADTVISQHELMHDVGTSADVSASQVAALTAEVDEHIEELRKLSASTGMLEFLRARLLMAEADWNEAAWKLQETRIRFASQPEAKHRIDLLLDQCYGRMGNPDKRLEVALVAVREAEEEHRWSPMTLRLPMLYERANQPENALKAYERLQGVLPSAALAVARLRVQQELFKPAESRRWAEISAFLDSENIQGLEDSADLTILRANVQSLEAAQLQNQGEAGKAEEKFRKAAAGLDAALAASPKSAELWAARAILELSLPFPERTAGDRIRAAEAILEKAHREVGDHVKLRLAAVQIAALLPPADALRELTALEQPPFPPEEQPEFLIGLAQAHARLARRSSDQQEKEAAIKRILDFRKEAAALQPEDMSTQVELAELGFQQRDEAMIQTALSRISKIEGANGPNGNYAEALKSFLTLKKDDRNEIERIRRSLRQAMKDRQFWAALPRLLGDLEFNLGNQDAAVNHYEKAFERGDRTPEVIERMVEYYFTHQRVAYADEFLRKVALDQPILLSGDLVRWQGEIAIRLGRTDEALGIVSGIASTSQNFKDHILESRLRQARGQRGAAVLNPLLKARDLAKDQPRPWMALVGYYVRVGKVDEAKATIEEAKQHIAKDPAHQRLLALAACYESVNDRDQAEQNYRAALESVADDDAAKPRLKRTLAEFYTRSQSTDPEQRQQAMENAQQLVDELLLASRDVPEDTRDWARRTKSLLIASSGNYQDTERALDQLAKSRDGDEVSNEDLRTEMLILRRRNRYKDRLELIKILETLADRNVLEPGEKLLLARTYESTNQWAKAQKRFRELLDEMGGESKSDRAKLLADYAIALLNRKDVDKTKMLAEAESLVAELEQLEPKSFRDHTTRAMLLYRQDRARQAADLLQEYIKSFDVQSPEQAFRDLVQQEKIDEALGSLAMLLDEKSAQLIIDEVRKLIAEGDQEEAVAVLERYIAASDLMKNVQTSLIRVIARFLEEIDQPAAAEESYRLFAKRSKQPEAILEVAAFLARQDRIDEALDICDAAWKTCDPRLVARVSVGTLRTSDKPTPTQVRRVEKPLASAVEKAKPEHWLQLITTFADLRDLQGRRTDSIDIYRKMLAKNPQNVTALNNLAWLLSYQSEAHIDALKYIQQAIALYGPAAALLDTRGMIYLRRGQTDKALADLKQAVEEAPAAGLYFHLAQAELAAGNKAAAETAFREAQAKNLDPISDLHVLEAEDYQRLEEMFK